MNFIFLLDHFHIDVKKGEEENGVFYKNENTKFTKKIVRILAHELSQDILLYQKYMALRSTVDYVQEKMESQKGFCCLQIRGLG
jgi:hypothetical protein